MSETAPTGEAAVVPQRPAPHPDVETAYLSPEAMLYDKRTGRVAHLNGPASAVWMLLDGTMDAATLADELSQIFGTDVATIRPDLDRVLSEFAQQGLLVEGG
jgi:hypothetical protein